ncbi:MAG: 2-C-methyl-D-erythritol 4-phosphate cytidylyltransferase, partial [Ruminococcus sp.]|nr:2-C-methyl-D-erythritol 4-phosphate cytidylyltransferase [Candidatus Copronaster equi]
NIAIVLAGGSGSRMGMVDRPKQFIDIYGKPVIIHTLEAFEINSNIDAICVICIKEWQDDLSMWLKEYDIRKVRWIADAGSSRQESSLNALDAIKNDCSDDDYVIIHDAARPLVSQKIINENIVKVRQFGACDTVIPAHDTVIKSVDSESLDSIPPRKELYLGQTPQSFKYSIVRKAYDDYFALPEDKRPVMTDDCGLVLQSGVKIGMAMGDKLNMKITTMEDLLLVKSIVRTGR